ncbi:DNA-directed DNA polymerase [Kitasatospora phosalacinea]|uniref:DNA-directed DNA polymerase n=1 Tax=Kitasatospora phosalacinea TaxID=2065 RepID=A0A9W6QCJ4_9ACTN|nr:PHP domain-containing protein [Kitasatospora phosalacinea]GLW73664.1 DNA-directed DNA polymerase [Kitasatospora phosalacinea]
MPAVHLHVASAFSARFGVSRPVELARRAAERGIAALALTDRDTTAGVVRHVRACRQAGVRPILGVDLAVEPADPAPSPAAKAGTAAAGGRSPVRGGAHVVEHPHRITLLATSRSGWAALCRLVSAAHLADGPPVISWACLREHAADGGLLALLGPASEPVRELRRGRADAAERLLAPWIGVFGTQVRLEAVTHCTGGQRPGSLRVAARTVLLGDRAGVPVVLSGAVRYADPGQHVLADVLDAARLLRPVDGRAVDSGRRWLLDAASMREAAHRIVAAAGLGEGRALRLLADTWAAGEECALQPHRDLQLGRAHLPEPHTVGAGPGPGAAGAQLRARCEAELVRRGRHRERRVLERLEDELAVISATGYPVYFLVVDQVVRDVREMGVRVAARGSAAGSLVCHLLGAAVADPLEHGLLFERFLTPRRLDMPDVDLDIEAHRRLDVYHRVIARFGPERTAVTGIAQRYRARQALRAAGLALGLEPDVVDEVTKAFPHVRASGIRAALGELPELRFLARRAERYGRLWELAEGLDGAVAGYAQHPCGLIVTDATLLERLPVQPAPTGGIPMVMADKDDVELGRTAGEDVGDGFGCIKLDLIGMRALSALAYSVREVARTTGRALDLDDPASVPLQDPLALAMVRASDTIGVPGLESPGQQELLSRLVPTTAGDVMTSIALFRPGPVASGMPAALVRTRRGAAPAYPHSDLEPVLRETLGVTVFHEQVIETIATVTGCDLALAEEARRALGDPARRERLAAWFETAAEQRGYDQAVRSAVWSTVSSFANYGFCKAHAAALAVPALQAAWLRAHFPAAHVAGVLEHEPGMWPARVIVADARRHQVPILPLDVNHSTGHYELERHQGVWGVRMALSAVHGITAAEIQRIVASRPYTSLPDLWERARPSRPVTDRLIAVGALDRITGPLQRRDLLLQAADLHRDQHTRDATDGQLPLPATGPTGAAATAAGAGLPEMTDLEKVSAELLHLGVDVSSHLMEHHLVLLRELGTVSARRLADVEAGTTVLVAGIRSSTMAPPTPTGRRALFLTLDGTDGMVDVAVFEDAQEHAARTIFTSGLLLVRGTVTRRGSRRASVTATACWDLTELAELRRDRGLAAVAARLAEQLPHPADPPGLGAGGEPGHRPGPHPPGPTLPRRTAHTSPGVPG